MDAIGKNMYKKRSDNFSEADFRKPDMIFRGAPFWAWNSELSDIIIEEQIKMFHEMGFGGVHIHSRTGMETKYLSDEYMDMVEYSQEECEKYGMNIWLYDEDRWPSGSAGGMVTENVEWRTQYLLFTPCKYGTCVNKKECHMKTPVLPGRGGTREENGTLLAIYDVVLNEEGRLVSYRRILEEEGCEGTPWYAYLEHATPSSWFNNSTYVDVLSQNAIQRFTQLTHDKYAQRLGNLFGTEIPAIFTDEPQHVYMRMLPGGLSKNCACIPWTSGYDISFFNVYGFSMLDKLPEVFFEKRNGISYARYAYHNHVADLFAENYCKTLSDWCSSHNIMLSGHLMWEATLQSQTTFIGDVMRCYPYFQLPGIDMLCDFHEYNTAKQAQSIVHQTGAPGMISELYGETGWDYDFRGHKLQGDWQAALGVSVRVPHLSWVSMKGEAKRDYPATMSYQSPWWNKYSYIETYFARVNTLMTRGEAKVHIGIIHPIESFYLHFGEEAATSEIRSMLDDQFAHLTELLLFHLLDFDFINEASLPGLSPDDDDIHIGRMTYDIIIIPNCEILRSTTIAYLTKFRHHGGRLLFIGKMPKDINAFETGNQHSIQTLYNKSEKCDFEDMSILKALEPYHFLSIKKINGNRPDDLLHQVRKEKDEYYLFIARGKNPVTPDHDPCEKLIFEIKGDFEVTEYHALTGDIENIQASYQNGKTIFQKHFFLHDSLLLRLSKRKRDVIKKAHSSARDAYTACIQEPIRFFDKVSVDLEEPNACLLDMAQYALDDGEYRQIEELLRLDNILRAELGMPQQSRDVVQPYIRKEKESLHELSLWFEIYGVSI